MAASSSTRNPLTPSRTTSRAAPSGNAITGVPHAIASTITSPNGSGHRIGMSTARAPREQRRLLLAPHRPLVDAHRVRDDARVTEGVRRPLELAAAQPDDAAL